MKRYISDINLDHDNPNEIANELIFAMKIIGVHVKPNEDWSRLELNRVIDVKGIVIGKIVNFVDYKRNDLGSFEIDLNKSQEDQHQEFKDYLNDNGLRLINKSNFKWAQTGLDW